MTRAARLLLLLLAVAGPATGARFEGIVGNYLNRVDDAPGYCHPAENCFGKDAAWAYCVIHEFDQTSTSERGCGAKWGGPSSDRQLRCTITAGQRTEISMGSSTTDFLGAVLATNNWYATCMTADGLSTATSGKVWTFDISARPIVKVDDGVWPADSNPSSPDGPITIGGRQGSDPWLGHILFSCYVRANLTEAGARLFAHSPRRFAARYPAVWCMPMYDDSGASYDGVTTVAPFTEIGSGEMGKDLHRAPTAAW